MASTGNGAASTGCEGKDGRDAEQILSLHKVWSKIEIDSSCSSDSRGRKVSVMNSLKGLQNVSTSSSASQSNSEGSVPGKPSAAGANLCAQAPSAAVDQQEKDQYCSEDEGDDEEEDELDPTLATIGSKLHSVGKCRPCHFYRAGNICRHSEACTFCHYHSDLRRKRPGKRRRAKLAQRSALAKAQAEAEAAACSIPAGRSQVGARSIVSL